MALSPPNAFSGLPILLKPEVVPKQTLWPSEAILPGVKAGRTVTVHETTVLQLGVAKSLTVTVYKVVVVGATFTVA